ncbi:MAG: arsenate reductase ArsC [Neomegalonema sp.]|nr:arsenate reductase ArsC [Neomegalonema sp.]
MINVLFLCTGNSARSVLSEALLNHHGGGRYRAYSAGSSPTGQVNPLTVKTLSAHGLISEGYSSKSWDTFAGPDAPVMDLVVTVCDNAKGETCPIWPGAPVQTHWGYEDPAAAEGTEAERLAVFERIYSEIDARIRAFVATSFDKAETVAERRAIASNI